MMTNRHERSGQENGTGLAGNRISLMLESLLIEDDPTWLFLLVLDLRRLDQMFSGLAASIAAALEMVPAFVVLHRVQVSLVRIRGLVAARESQAVVEALIVDVVAEGARVRKPLVDLGPRPRSGRVGRGPAQSTHQAVRVEPRSE